MKNSRLLFKFLSGNLNEKVRYFNEFLTVLIYFILVSDTIADLDRSRIRPASIGVSPPPKLISLEEARTSRNLSSVAGRLQTNSVKETDKDVPLAEQESSSDLSSPEFAPFRGGSPLSPTATSALKPGKNYIDVGEGPDALPEYHTVIELPSRKKQNITRTNRKWKSLFGKRPETAKTSRNLSLRRPPMRQRSFEDAVKKDQGKVRSKSVDELSREDMEHGKGKSLSISYPISRNKYNPQESVNVTGKSKFYVEPDLPPEGIRGTFMKSRVGSPDARVANTSESRDGEDKTKRTQPPPRPVTSPPAYRQSVMRTKSGSPGQVNGKEFTFFVAGRVDKQTNAKSIEVVRAPSLNSLKTAVPVANEENGRTDEV